MEDRTEIQRRVTGEDYRLNVVQIPLLRGLGCGILCLYVLLYDLLIAPPFSWSRYLEFAGILAVYCFGSWLILQKAYQTLFSYILFIFYLAEIEGRPVDWRMEILKIAYVFGVNLYLAVTSRPAE